MNLTAHQLSAGNSKEFQKAKEKQSQTRLSLKSLWKAEATSSLRTRVHCIDKIIFHSLHVYP